MAYIAQLRIKSRKLTSQSAIDGKYRRQKVVNSQMNDKWMLDRQQDFFLVLNVVDLFETNNFSDWQHFEREVLARWSMPRQNNTTESSCSLTKKKHKQFHSSHYNLIKFTK